MTQSQTVWSVSVFAVRALRCPRPWVNRTHEEHVCDGNDYTGKPCPAFCLTKARPRSSALRSRGHVADHRDRHPVMLVRNQASTHVCARCAPGSPSTVKPTADELYIQEFWHHVNSRFLMAQFKACRQMPLWVLENGCSRSVPAMFNSSLTAFSHRHIRHLHAGRKTLACLRSSDRKRLHSVQFHKSHRT